jgi:hypothetical protein
MLNSVVKFQSYPGKHPDTVAGSPQCPLLALPVGGARDYDGSEREQLAAVAVGAWQGSGGSSEVAVPDPRSAASNSSGPLSAKTINQRAESLLAKQPMVDKQSVGNPGARALVTTVWEVHPSGQTTHGLPGVRARKCCPSLSGPRKKRFERPMCSDSGRRAVFAASPFHRGVSCSSMAASLARARREVVRKLSLSGTRWRRMNRRGEPRRLPARSAGPPATTEGRFVGQSTQAPFRPSGASGGYPPAWGANGKNLAPVCRRSRLNRWRPAGRPGPVCRATAACGPVHQPGLLAGSA